MSLFDDIVANKSNEEICEALDMVGWIETYVEQTIIGMKEGKLPILRDKLEHYFQDDYTLEEQVLFEQNETDTLNADEHRIAAQLNWGVEW